MVAQQYAGATVWVIACFGGGVDGPPVELPAALFAPWTGKTSGPLALEVFLSAVPMSETG